MFVAASEFERGSDRVADGETDERADGATMPEVEADCGTGGDGMTFREKRFLPARFDGAGLGSRIAAMAASAGWRLDRQAGCDHARPASTAIQPVERKDSA